MKTLWDMLESLDNDPELKGILDGDDLPCTPETLRLVINQLRLIADKCEGVLNAFEKENKS